MLKFRVFFAAGLTMVLLACETAGAASRRDLAMFEQQLRLTMTPARTQIASGEELRLGLRIKNIGERAVATCLGPLRVANFWGLDSKYAKGTAKNLVDHPSCERRLSLQAGETYDWLETFTVPQLPAGRSRLSVAVQLVSTKNCDQYGCDSTHVSGTFEPLLIVAPSN